MIFLPILPTRPLLSPFLSCTIAFLDTDVWPFPLRAPLPESSSSKLVVVTTPDFYPRSSNSKPPPNERLSSSIPQRTAWAVTVYTLQRATEAVRSIAPPQILMHTVQLEVNILGHRKALTLVILRPIDEVLDTLLDQEGLEVDPIDRLEADTPLHKAVRFVNGLPKTEWEAGGSLVELLLDAGADPRSVTTHHDCGGAVSNDGTYTDRVALKRQNT